MAGPGIRMILVELRFHRAGRPLQDLAPEGGLQSFEVQGFGRQGTHQGPDFLPDLLRQRFLEPFGPSGPKKRPAEPDKSAR